MRQHHGLDLGACRHRRDLVQTHVTLSSLSHDAFLLCGSHGLPATVFDHHLLPILARRRFGDEQISAFCKFSDAIAGACVSGKHDHTVRRFNTVRIGLVLTGSGPLVKGKMAVFDSRHLDVLILVEHPGANVMTEEQFSDRYGTTPVSYPDFGTNREILHSGFDQLFCPGRAIDVNRLRSLAIPGHGHQGTKASCMIVMMVGNKNCSDLPDIYTSLRNTPCDAVAGINDIVCPVDG